MAIGIGETLRAARRDRGATLADAATETRIRPGYLVALEADDFETLGEDVYVRGFLRSYANYLGLNPDPLLAEYGARFQREADHALTVTPAVPSRTPLPGPVRAAAAAGTLVVLLTGVAVLGDRDRDAAPAPLPTAGAELTRGPAEASPPPQPAAAPTPSPVQTPASSPEPIPGVQVDLHVSGAPSWVRATVDGTVVLEATLEDGASHTFHGDQQVALRVGNAAAVRLTLNGEDLGQAGAPGEVVELEFPAPSPTSGD